MAAHLRRVGSVLGVPQIGLLGASSLPRAGMGGVPGSSRICSDDPACLPFSPLFVLRPLLEPIPRAQQAP